MGPGCSPTEHGSPEKEHIRKTLLRAHKLSVRENNYYNTEGTLL